ncbi:MAG: hypothetical protein ACRC0Y_01380 [Fusobacteriaceae bacterium]
MGKSSYNGGSTIIYMPNARKVLLKKIYESVSDLLDEEFSLSFITKIFNEYDEYELHNIDQDISFNFQLKRKYWIDFIKKHISTKSVVLKKKSSVEKIKSEEKFQNIFKKENITKKKIIKKYNNITINNSIVNLELLNLKIKNHPNILIRERAQKDAAKLEKRINELIKLEEENNKKNKKKKIKNKKV